MMHNLAAVILFAIGSILFAAALVSLSTRKNDFPAAIFGIAAALCYVVTVLVNA